MDTDDIVFSQLVTLGVDAVAQLQEKGTTNSKLECEELYSIILDVLKLMHKRSGQAAKDQADGTRSGVVLLPKKVPKSKSTRFSICENMAKELTNYGCDTHKGDYNYIMYPTVEGTKALLKWLSDALMKTTEDERQREIARKAAEESAESELSLVMGGLRMLKSSVESGRSTTTTIRKRRAVGGALPAAYKFHATADLHSVKEDERVTFVDAVTHEFKGYKNTKALGPALFNSVIAFNSMQDTIQPKFTQARNRPLSAEGATLGTSVDLYTASGAAHRRNQAKASATLADNEQDVGSKSAAALFYNSGESGLDPAEFHSRKSAEKEAQAAMQELEEKHRTAQERGKQQKEEVASLKNELKAAKKEYALRKAQIKALKSVKEDLDAQEAAAVEALGANHSARLAALAEKQELLELMENPKQSLADYEASAEELSEQQRAAREDFLKKMQKVEGVRDRLNDDLQEAGAGKDEKLRSLRGECKDLKKQVKEKVAEVESLKQEYESCPKDIDRSKYLRYIFDMTNNLQRQQEEIDKVRKDTQGIDDKVQDIGGEVKSIFERLEKVVYESATATSGKNTSDVFCKDGYKQIVDLRSSYMGLVDLIQDRGMLKKEMHEADEKSAKLRRTVGEYDLGQVEKDLVQVNEEYTKVQQYFASGEADASDI